MVRPSRLVSSRYGRGVGDGRRLKPEEHARHPWRVHEIAPDFELVDAWALPATGSLPEFDDLCDIFENLDMASSTDRRLTPARALFAVRKRLGTLLGWDDETNTLPIPGADETSLRDRLPGDLEPPIDDGDGHLFRTVFRTPDELTLELSNSTVHAIVHLGWVPRGDQTYQGQLGVYVKHRGRIGRPYMAAIAPFRHRVVYPAMLDRIGKAWRARPKRRAVVAVMHADGRFLWIKRGPRVRKPGYWTPPSGALEPGETPQQALVREMAEELGITVRPIRSVWQCAAEDADFQLDWWLVDIESGSPHPVDEEVAELRWVSAADIHDLSPTFASHLTFIDEIWPSIDQRPSGSPDR